MKINNIRLEDSATKGYFKLSAEAHYNDGSSDQIWFEFHEKYKKEVSITGNPWAVLMLPLAMQLGEVLTIDAPVDSALLKNLRDLQEIWHCWYPKLSMVRIVPREVLTEKQHSSGRVGSFFSGGVDSFYTAIKNNSSSGDTPRLTDLIFVWGFDIRLDQFNVGTQITQDLTQIANELELNLLPVLTNVRQTRWSETNWPAHSHGVALGAVGLCLESRFSALLIPSTESYKQLYPWGSHALTDPLSSTSSMEVRHDGAEASRFQKVFRLVSSPSAMKSLRVCWRSSNGLNCCKCQKCIRTMLELEVIGSLKNCTAFEKDFTDLRSLRKVYMEWDLIPDYLEIYSQAKKLGRYDICISIKYALLRTKIVDGATKILKAFRKIPGCKIIADPIKTTIKNACVH